MKIKVRTKEQQAIDNLKPIVNSKDKIIEIEPPIEDTAQILLDYITKLQKYYNDIVNKYEELLVKYSNLDEKYKKSCETYQQALDETMSEKIDLEENKILKELNVCVDCNNNSVYKSRNEKAIELLKKYRYQAHCIDVDDLLNILGGDDNENKND